MVGNARSRFTGQAWSVVVLIAMVLRFADTARAGGIGDPKPPPPPAVQPDTSGAPNGRLPARSHPVRTGATAGAITGGIVGAGLFLLGGAVAEGLCEYDCGDIAAPGYIGLGLIGGALGAVAGALVGAFFGSTVRPTEVPPEVSPPRIEPGSAEPERPLHATPVSPARGPDDVIGSFTILGGYADIGDQAVFEENGFTSHAARGGGGLIQARFLSHRGEWISFGPEVGIVGSENGLFLLTGDLVVGRQVGRFRPYVIGDAGWYNWRDNQSLLGAGVGAGLEWSRRPGSQSFGLEARYHGTLQTDTEAGDRAFGQVALTTRFAW